MFINQHWLKLATLQTTALNMFINQIVGLKLVCIDNSMRLRSSAARWSFRTRSSVTGDAPNCCDGPGARPHRSHKGVSHAHSRLRCGVQASDR